MSLPISLVYPCDAAKWKAVLAEFQAHEIDVPDLDPKPDKAFGTIKSRGVVAEYNWDGESISVKVTRKPLLATEGYVRGMITDLFESIA